MGSPYPCLTSQGELYICLRFQYWCYSKHEPPKNRVKPTPLQVLRHISSLATASGDPLLMTEKNMIIITYFLLLYPGECTVSKSESTPFRLKETAFICGHSVFATMAKKGYLQAAIIFTLTFMTHKNGVRE